MGSLASVNLYFFKYKWHLMLGALFVVLSCVFSVYQGKVIGDATDSIIALVNSNQVPQVGEFFYFGGILLGLALISGFFLFLMRQTLIVMSRHIEYDQKNAIYKHYQTLDATFYKGNSVGDLMNRISEDVGKVRMYTGPSIMYLINTVATIVTVLFFMFSINWELSVIVFIPLPLLAYVIYRVSNTINKKSNKVQQQLSKITTQAQETFSAIRVIKSYNREAHYCNGLDNMNLQYKKLNINLTYTEALFFPVMILMIGISILGTVWYGGYKVVLGDITSGDIAAFITFVYKLTWPFASLGWVTSLIQRATASQTRINEFLTTTSSITNEHLQIHPIDGSIEFRSVTFTYPDSGITVLKNYNLNIRAGEKLGVMGRVGTGKSTIANLIPRLYDVNEGGIFLSSINIKYYDVHYLRQQIGYVPQDVFLFSDTIKNNIAFSTQKHYTDSMIHQAAKDAGVYDNIMSFPNQFDTIIGERGITLSGGQKQRISIARALISNPKILILDDCLSAVDIETEEAILTSLQTIMKNKTTIVISHRESTLRQMDRVITLN